MQDDWRWVSDCSCLACLSERAWLGSGFCAFQKTFSSSVVLPRPTIIHYHLLFYNLLLLPPLLSVRRLFFSAATYLSYSAAAFPLSFAPETYTPPSHTVGDNPTKKNLFNFFFCTYNTVQWTSKLSFMSWSLSLTVSFPLLWRCHFADRVV
jgi:hypothetical protein